jgi:hypothetical protein
VSEVDGSLLAASIDTATDLLLLTVLSSADSKTELVLSLSDGLAAVMQSITITITGDTDDDGMPDAWERDNGLDPNQNDAEGDGDQDGLSNLEEFNLLTNPQSDDSDNDGMPDGWEVEHGLVPSDPADATDDADDDGVPNALEFAANSDPNDAATPPSEVYVSTTGTDAPAGGAENAPWRTLGFALDQVSVFALQTHPVTISLEPGNYDEAVVLVPYITLSGQGDTPFDTLIQFFEPNVIIVQMSEDTRLENLTVTTPQPEQADLVLVEAGA